MASVAGEDGRTGGTDSGLDSTADVSAGFGGVAPVAGADAKSAIVKPCASSAATALGGSGSSGDGGTGSGSGSAAISSLTEKRSVLRIPFW